MIASILGAVLSWYILFGFLEKVNIDTLNYFQATGESSEEIVVVGIDEISFSSLEMQWPWPREVHGALGAGDGGEGQGDRRGLGRHWAYEGRDFRHVYRCDGKHGGPEAAQ